MNTMLTLVVFVQSRLASLRDERGAVAAEYGLVIALVAVAIIVGATALGTNLNTHFQNVANKIGGVVIP